MSCRGGRGEIKRRRRKAGLTVNHSVSFHSSLEWGNLIWMCLYVYFVPVRQQSLIDSPFSPCHSCLSSCQTKRQLYVDLLYIGISYSSSSFSLRSSFSKKLEDFLSESLLFGFQDEIITSHFMIDGSVFRSPFRLCVFLYVCR